MVQKQKWREKKKEQNNNSLSNRIANASGDDDALQIFILLIERLASSSCINAHLWVEYLSGFFFPAGVDTHTIKKYPFFPQHTTHTHTFLFFSPSLCRFVAPATTKKKETDTSHSALGRRWKKKINPHVRKKKRFERLFFSGKRWWFIFSCSLGEGSNKKNLVFLKSGRKKNILGKKMKKNYMYMWFFFFPTRIPRAHSLF